MEHLRPPTPLPASLTSPVLFLAGSIAMGAAENWQDEVVAALADRAGTVLNPRRDEWDAS